MFQLLQSVIPGLLATTREPSAPYSQPPATAPRAAARSPEPFAEQEDRLEANQASIHKLICANRESQKQRGSELQEAAAQQAASLRSCCRRALGVLPFGALGFEIDALSQAGLFASDAVGMAMGLSFLAASVLAVSSVGALKRALKARAQQLLLQGRIAELGALDQRMVVAASGTFKRLEAQKRRPSAPQMPQSPAASAHPGVAQPRHARPLPLLPQALSTALTPSPGVRPRGVGAPGFTPMANDTQADRIASATL